MTDSLFLTRKLAAAVAALLLIVAASSAQAQTSANSCEEAAGVAVLPTPIAPWKGMPLRVMVAAEKPLDGELSLIAPDGSVAAKSGSVRGGPPYYWFAEVATPAVGKWQATLTRGGATCVTRDIVVAAQKPPGPGKAE